MTVYVKPWDCIVLGIFTSLSVQYAPSETEAVRVSISKEYFTLLSSVNVVDISSVVPKFEAHAE